MRLLLDTHAFVWWDANDPHLPSRMRDAIASPDNEVFISSASVWEIAVKRASGKLDFSGSIEAIIETHGFHQLPISARHAEWVGSLQPIHSDPFDRMLVAQAQVEGLTLVTLDKLVLRYLVARL